jgi:hypothetical protein
MMCELTAEQQRQLEARMAADPGLAQGLAPLLAGRFGADARDLVLCCLSRRLAAGWSIDVAPLLALTDATQIAARQYEGAE